jgi:hypothetical protein
MVYPRCCGKIITLSGNPLDKNGEGSYRFRGVTNAGMVRPKEWLLIIPRTAVEGGEDIFNEGTHSFGN